MLNNENKLLNKKHILICVETNTNQTLNIQHNTDYTYIKNNFCGTVITNNEFNDANILNNTDNSFIYLCGNIQYFFEEMYGNFEKHENHENNNLQHNKLFVIKEHSSNYLQYVENNNLQTVTVVTTGQVPINVYNTGVLFRNFFINDIDSNKDYFNSICDEHKFQSLTESNKPSNAYRKGIYLTNVKEEENKLLFNLLRCSSNLDGPTENFKNTDNEIITKVNDVATYFFEQKTDLNHVLAQIYENQNIENDKGIQVERKARIKEHSDKTKDMASNGLMAFCTFYKDFLNNEKYNQKCYKKNNYDCFMHTDSSIFTKIRFRLKKCVVDNANLNKSFDITLYPNSVFIMSLSTNRLYTHEIIPSILPIDKIPVRMGYVVRCSKTKAIFKNEQTYVVNDTNDINNEYIKLQKLDENNEDDNENIKKLKDVYYQENMTDELVKYDEFNFSLNDGDYKKPVV